MLGWLGRTGLGLLTLCVAVPTVAAAVLILLPPLFGAGGWQVRLLLGEWSLLLFLPAVLCIVLAGAAHWVGWRGRSVLIAALAVLSLGLAVLPPVRGALAADAAGVRLRPLEYFAGTVRESVRQPDATVTYQGTAGLRLDVWRPRDPVRRAAAVVLVDGGDRTSRSVPGKRGQAPRWAAWLADQGFVVFDIDYRPSRPGDVTRAVAWAGTNAGKFGVDPGRIVLMGTAVGGNLALLAAYADPPPVAAVVTLYAPTELTSWFTANRPWWYSRRLWDSRRDSVLAFTGGPPDRVPDAYHAAEPIRLVRPGLPPTLLVQGGSDLLTPPAPTRRLADALKQAGNDARYVEIEYADHGFDVNWGGFASQITRAELAAFLRPVRDRPEPAD